MAIVPNLYAQLQIIHSFIHQTLIECSGMLVLYNIFENQKMQTVFLKSSQATQ